MIPDSLPPIAIVADAHFHHGRGDYGNAGIVVDGRRMNVRPLADTIKSTRVFNESGPALRATLDDVARRGIRHVVLLGDYSDDGQVETLRGLRGLLDEYRQRHGLMFFAVPGNHDIFGPEGRHRSKRFLDADLRRDLVTSDPHRPLQPGDDALVLDPAMRCLGYPEGLEALRGAGFFGNPAGLYWETPFGTDPDAGKRRYMVTSRDGHRSETLVDGSCLAEPFDGLWLLMIDANVFVPTGEQRSAEQGGFEDSTDAGWNALLRHKRFLLDWMADVSLRARKSGKMLLAFSHYPVLDPLDGTRDDELALLGKTGLVRRIPDRDVGEALIDAGIGIHFSGHLHVNDTARMETDRGWTVNVAVPSLVGFPAAYKVARVSPPGEPGRLIIQTIGIGAIPMPPHLRQIYRAEAERRPMPVAGILAAETYGEFLHAHIGTLVGRRHLRREWPADLAGLVDRLSLADLAQLARSAGAVTPGELATSAWTEPFAGSGDELTAALADIPLRRFVDDWYRVRMGSELGLRAVAAGDLEAYRMVAKLYGGGEFEPGSAQAAFAMLMRIFDRCSTGLPSSHFSIDLASGAVHGVAEDFS